MNKKSASTKAKTVNIRVDAVFKKVLRKLAKEKGLSDAAYIRTLVLEKAKQEGITYSG